MTKWLTFATLSFFFLVCGQSIQTAEGALGPEGGVLKAEEVEEMREARV